MTSPTTRADFLYGWFQYVVRELVHREQHAAVHGLEAVTLASGSARPTMTLIE
jgi:hypothetical protein